MITAHIDSQTDTIDGVSFKNIHSGQKKAYGDSFYEYEVQSDLPARDVEHVCSDKVYNAISETVWRSECAADGSADKYFRAHYVFKDLGAGRYFYQVCFPYTD